MYTIAALRSAIYGTVLAFGFVAATASAQSAKSVINVMTTTSYPPLASKDATSNKLVGFDIDIVNAIGAKMGAKVNWIESSFEQMLTSIATRRADLAVSINDAPDRRALVSFVDYWRSNLVFFTLRANSSNFTNMEALCGKRVAANRTNAWPAEIARWSDEHCVRNGKPAVIVVGSLSSPDSRLQLSQGRVDAAAQGQEGVSYQNTLEDDRFVVIGKPVSSKDLGLAFAKDDPQFGQALKKALGELLADGTYARLLRKWKLPDEAAISQPMINGQP